MNSKTRQLLAAGLWLALAVHTQAYPGVEVPVPGMAPLADRWPADVVKTMTGLLAVKAQGMKMLNMRSENGVVGYRFGQLMDQLASQSDAAGLAEKARTLGGEDITAKLIVLARDRRARPDLYRRIAADYVDWPEDSNAYYEGGAPHITEPKRVKREDINDATLPALEYAFFAPPCGGKFEADTYRQNLATAMRRAGGAQKRVILLGVDFLWAVVCLKPDMALSCETNCAAFWELAGNPDELSYRILAGIRGVGMEVVREITYERMPLVWTPGYSEYYGSKNPEADSERIYKEWMRLAEREWDQPREKNFAKFLKGLPKPGPGLAEEIGRKADKVRNDRIQEMERRHRKDFERDMNIPDAE